MADMFWEHFAQTLARGYVVVPYPNPLNEFVYIHVSWVTLGMLLATFIGWFGLLQVTRMSKPRRKKTPSAGSATPPPG
jgi:hypothetical protein